MALEVVPVLSGCGDIFSPPRACTLAPPQSVVVQVRDPVSPEIETTRRTPSCLMPDQPRLNQMAVVTGATRGAGPGVVRMLGAAGATVLLHRSQPQGAPRNRRAA